MTKETSQPNLHSQCQGGAQCMLKAAALSFLS